jgi:hypothetical protein
VQPSDEVIVLIRWGTGIKVSVARPELAKKEPDMLNFPTAKAANNLCPRLTFSKDFEVKCIEREQRSCQDFLQPVDLATRLKMLKRDSKQLS